MLARHAKHLLAAALVVASQLVLPAIAADTSPTVKPADVADVILDAQTEQTVQGALRFLASKQSPSGAWSEKEHPLAFTAYTMMAFLAAGNLPGEGEYGKTMTRGMGYILDCVGSNGYISSASATAG